MALSDYTALEIFRIVAAEYEDLPDATVELYFDLAAQSVSAAIFGDRYRQAIVYLAAHLISMDQRAEAAGGGGGAAGPVIGERAGEVSVNYGFSASSGGNAALDSTYGSTAYGKRYMALLRQRPGTKAISTQQYKNWPVDS